MDERLCKLEKFEKRAANELVVMHQVLRDVCDFNLILEEKLDCSADKDDLANHVYDTSSRMMDISDTLKQYAADNNALLAQFKVLESVVAKLESKLALANHNLEVLVSAIAPHMQECKHYRSTAQQNVDKALENMRKGFQAYLDNIPRAETVDLSVLKNDMMTIVRQALDEMKVAGNRTITNQSRIHILEKKVAKLGGEA